MGVCKLAHHDLAADERRQRDVDAVAQVHRPMRLRPRAVDLDLAAVAKLLRLRPGPRQARNIEPHVQTNALGHGGHSTRAYNVRVLLLPGALLLLCVVVATLAGGMVPFRFEQHSRVFLSFSAGTLVALALLELIPEGIAGRGDDVHRLLLIVLAAFLATLLLDKLHVLHPHEHGMDASCPHQEHEHAPLAMHGALGLILHSAVDGLALAAALRESVAAGIAVGVALSAHKLADGLTTVALVLSHHHRRRQAVRMLAGNVAALCLGFAGGIVLPLHEAGLSVLLLMMAGFFLYLGATDLLPAVTSPRCRKRDVLATALGMAAIATVSLLAH